MMPGQATRAEEIKAFRQLGDSASLLRCLPSCQGPIRKLAFEALRALESPAARPMLQVLSLGRAAGSTEEQAFDELWPKMTRAALLVGLQSPEPRCRALAARTLGEIGELSTLQPLLAQIEREPTNMARIEMTRAAELFGDGPEATRVRVLFWAGNANWQPCLALGEQALPALLELATTPTGEAIGEQLRCETLQRLGDLDRPQLLPTFVGLLADPHARVRITALAQIAKNRNGIEHIDAVAHLLGAREPEVRQEAVRVLEQLGGPVARQRLGEFAARCTELADRLAVGEVLARLGDPATLAQLTTHAEPTIRHEAVVALGRAGHRAAIEPLVQVLGDAYHEVRQAARQALEGLGWRPVGFKSDREQASLTFWTVPDDWGGLEDRKSVV